MASGLAVVAFDSAAAGQLIEPGRDGMLAADDSEAGFVRAALQAAPAQRRVSLGAAARSRVRALDWSEIVARFDAVLEAAIDAQAAHEPLAPRARLRRHAA
jgi:glycosyltransferase involved in cell wall biosynthesis